MRSGPGDPPRDSNEASTRRSRTDASFEFVGRVEGSGFSALSQELSSRRVVPPRNPARRRRARSKVDTRGTVPVGDRRRGSGSSVCRPRRRSLRAPCRPHWRRSDVRAFRRSCASRSAKASSWRLSRRCSRFGREALELEGRARDGSLVVVLLRLPHLFADRCGSGHSPWSEGRPSAAKSRRDVGRIRSARRASQRRQSRTSRSKVSSRLVRQHLYFLLLGPFFDFFFCANIHS